MNLYNMDTPFTAKIKCRKLLTQDCSTKNTYHIILDIKNLDIEYQPGDSIAILPQNEIEVVNAIIKSLNANADFEIKNNKNNQPIKLFDFLLFKANITKPCRKFLKLFLKKPTTDEFKKYLSYHIIDLLKEFSECKIDLQKFCSNLSPLLPRLYSAASSLKIHPHEIHLIVTHVSYELFKVKRNGVCTQFLCHSAKTEKTPILCYIEPSHNFHLPKNKESPIIMICAGCGLSPFKAFLEERYLDNTGQNWLFFGERNKKTDFYFENFLTDLVDKNLLRLTTAFSRDQNDKIYVQDKVLENQSDIWQWIQRGSKIYVCGDAKMSKSVDETLKLIFIEEGNLNPQQALDYLQTLIKEKQYLKDVY